MKKQNGMYAFSFGLSDLRNRNKSKNGSYQRQRNVNVLKASTSNTAILSP